MLYFSLFYFVFLYSFFIFKEFLFFNEEVLIAACMLIVFFFLVKSLRKMVNFIFFFKAETIYFSFLNLILLNIKLIDKMLNLVKLEGLRFDSLLSLQLYTSFNAFSTELLAKSKLLNLLFIKNFIYALVSNIYTLQFFSVSSNFLTSIAVNAAKGLTTEFSLLDTPSFFFLSSNNKNSEKLLKKLALNKLYALYLKNMQSSAAAYIAPKVSYLSDFTVSK